VYHEVLNAEQAAETAAWWQMAMEVPSDQDV
jgi:hypothetical protein